MTSSIRTSLPSSIATPVLRLVAMLAIFTAPAVHAQSLDDLERKLESERRAEGERKARQAREAEQAKAAQIESARQAQIKKEREQRDTAAASELAETLHWLEVYFATTNEKWAGYDKGRKLLSTTSVDNGVTANWTYELCTTRDVPEQVKVIGVWNGQLPTATLALHWPNAKGAKDGVSESFNGWSFQFPQPTYSPPTVPSGESVRLADGTWEPSRERLLAMTDHPIHRFRRAFVRLIELECGPRRSSPFE